MLNISKDKLASLFSSKYSDPYTRQEYFGGLSTGEFEVLSARETTVLLDSKEDSDEWFLVELKTEQVITRLHPEFAGKNLNHVVTGILETHSRPQCPLTGKKMYSSWKYYVTKKMMDEIKNLAE